MRAPRIATTLLVVLAACSSGTGRSTGPTATPARPTATSASPVPTPVTTSGPSPSGGTTGPGPTAPTPTPTSTGTRPPAIPVPGLPEQGVAVERDGGVDLYDVFDGKRVAHLDGFTIYDPTAIPSRLVLQRGGTYYELEEFERRLRPLASRRAADRRIGHDQTGLDLPAPTSNGRPMDGHWRYETNDPHYEGRVLAQWSGECEVPTAFFVDGDEGEVEPVTGEDDPADAPESFALGWTKRGQAVVFLPEGACGGGTNPPGVYLYRDAGKGRLLVATGKQAFARMWGNTIAD